MSQRRLERLTYHQKINCKLLLILRLRNGKQKKGRLLGLRHEKEEGIVLGGPDSGIGAFLRRHI